MSEFDYSSYCNELLFKEFPDLLKIPRYKETFEDIQRYLKGKETAHAIYEDIFCHYTVDLFKERVVNHGNLKKVFALIEKISSQKDFETSNVAEVSFLEPLFDKVKPAKIVLPYLGKVSLKKAIDAVTFRYGWNEDPKTWN